MKRRELVRTLERHGAVFIRHGGKHDWYQKPMTKICQPVPRHTEIKDYLARANDSRVIQRAAEDITACHSLRTTCPRG